MLKKFGHVKIPFKRIHLELTNVCDFNCAFCPKCLMTRPYGYMKSSLAREAVSEIKESGLAEKITFHVMGEPTLHPDFFGILDYARQKGQPVGLTTNGAGLGGKIGRGLLDYHLHQIDVSLQTPDAASFALRGSKKLGFDDYLNGVMSFFSAYRAKYKDTIFKLRFLNTTIPQKSIEKKNGPVRVISSTGQLRQVFADWTRRMYEAVGPEAPPLSPALERIDRLVSYKWNVVEIMPRVFLETYILADWGHAFQTGKVHDAWAGVCDGMRDHFAVLYNGDVTLCCIDFNGRTAVGNLRDLSLREVLSSPELGAVMKGFRRYKPVHPYCKRCLGGAGRISWLTRPAAVMVGLHLLRPYFYRQVKLFD